MALTIGAERLDTGGANLEYDRNPDVCPLCHVRVMPRRGTAILTEHSPFNSVLQIVFRCTNNECDRLFIGYYRQRSAGGVSLTSQYYLDGTAPRTPLEESFSEYIENLSPTFVEIYNQAIAAESEGLTQLTGMGLRKSLEFLIKDFLIKQRPADAENIKKVMLGSCINNYVDDSRIKSVASRATWLGNDETHYVREFVDRDLEDMKRLVKLTVNWVESVLLTEEYEAQMKSKKGGKK